MSTFTPIPGCDFSAARPSVAQLHAAGMQFVIRYLKILPNAYAITKPEFDMYRAAGIDVVLNWEQTENDWQGGYARGQQYASQAQDQAIALGAWPCPIYFSVDTGSFSPPQVVAYFQGVASVLGASRVGIYGGLSAISLAQAQHLAAYLWQTYAWSGGQWAGGLNLRQVPGSVPGFASDLDWAYTADYGQVGGSPVVPVLPGYTGGDMGLVGYTTRPGVGAAGAGQDFVYVQEGAANVLHAWGTDLTNLQQEDVKGAVDAKFGLGCSWTPDGNTFVVTGVGTDGRVWTNVWSGQWLGWGAPQVGGSPLTPAGP